MKKITQLKTNSTIFRAKRTYQYGVPNVPPPINEPIFEYGVGSKERTELQNTIKSLRNNKLDIPLIIGGKEVKTGQIEENRIPHDHKHVLATYHKASEKEVKQAIESSLQARKKWAETNFETRASIFLRAAEMIASYKRYEVNAGTVLNQSKNYFQSEIDAVCETIDFLRFGVKYAEEIYRQQPLSTRSSWNRMYYRPLEGFVYAATPFNFTSIGANLTFAPAIMGNVVIWKPSDATVFSNYQIMKIYQEAGLPDGVINYIPGPAETVSNLLFENEHFGGIHYTGSTAVFKNIWRKIGNNIDKYRSYPKIVGETGGKDFIFAHASADIRSLATALIRGAFESQGQKCSAASRAYIPQSIWDKLKKEILDQMSTVKVGSPEDPTVLVGAVIHQRAFDKVKSYIEYAKQSKDMKIIYGGQTDNSSGYFIHPTIVQSMNPKSKLMVEEIFGPVLTLYVYPDSQYMETLQLVDTSVEYALTGSVFANDEYAIEKAFSVLKETAGNFYINDKPTGAVVGQQPFGGSRASGTNDKAGSYLNLLRWVSPLTVKTTFTPPTHFSYSYMK